MARSALSVLGHATALLAGALLLGGFLLYPIELGRQSLELRAALGSLAALLLVAGARPLIPAVFRRLPLYAALVGVPAVLLSPWYFLSHLPARAGTGVSGEQLATSMITESTSNGIVEIGFAYPIYTPTIRLQNHEAFTRDVDVYLRVLDGNDDPALFRAVREQLPEAGLSVEATVRGLLSDSPGYLFLPVALPPRSSVAGRLVFIISDLNAGSTFNEALVRGYPGDFQVRAPGTGDLLLSFPMGAI